MHRILAILILVVVTCFLSIGGNHTTSTYSDNQYVLSSYNGIIIENYDDMKSVSVVDLLPDGGSNNAMKDIIR